VASRHHSRPTPDFDLKQTFTVDQAEIFSIPLGAGVA